MAVVLKQSTEIKVRIGPFVDATDGKTPETAVALSTADEAELLKANGAATVDISGATWAAVTGADGWYDLTLTTSHTDTIGELVVVVHDDSVCLPVHRTFQVVEEAIYDALYGSGATAPATAAELAKVPKSDGSVTWNATALASINAEVDTAFSDYAPATAAELAKVPKSDGTATWNATALASINAEVDTAFSDYAPATATELAKVPKSDGTVTWNATALASINTQCDTALSDIGATTTRMGYLDFVNSRLLGTIAAGTHVAQTGDSYAIVNSGTFGNSAIKAVVDSVSSQSGTLISGQSSISTQIGNLNDLSTSDVKTQVDASLVGIHLDHLFAATYDPSAQPGVSDALMNELIESDAGVSRFTANALEQAPAGGGGGDATEAKQDTIIASLGGWTGTGVNNVLGAFQAVLRKDADVTVPSDINADLGSGVGTASNITDSLQAIRDRGDSAWTPGGGVTITPLSAGDVQRSTGTTITAYEGETSAITVYAISDVDGNAVDLTTYSALEVVIESRSGTVLQTIAHGSLGLTDAGNLTFTPSATVTGTVTVSKDAHFWSLRDTTNGDYVVAQGRMNIVRVATDA